MNLTIIGTGNVGSALATTWARTGHHVAYGVRDTNSFKGAATISETGIAVQTIPDAVKDAEAILVAIPPQHVTSLINVMGDLNGKVIIDATNSVRTAPDGYPTAYHAFAALARGAEVVKCFNSTGFENMKDPVYGSQRADMFMAGDSRTAKDIARRLALDAGFADCYDFGGADQVQLLEKFALSWINLAIFQGHGRGIAFKVMRK